MGMRGLLEVSWLWQMLGISLLVAGIGIACAALIQKRRGKRLRAGVAVLIAVIAFVVCNLLMVPLSQRPALL